MVSFVCLTCGNPGGCDSKRVTLTKEQKRSGKTLRSDVIVLEEHMAVLLFFFFFFFFFVLFALLAVAPSGWFPAFRNHLICSVLDKKCFLFVCFGSCAICSCFKLWYPISGGAAGFAWPSYLWFQRPFTSTYAQLNICYEIQRFMHPSRTETDFHSAQA